MAARKLEVVFVGDTKDLEGKLGKLGRAADKNQGKWSKLGESMKAGLAVGAAGAAVGIKKATDAAVDLNEEVNKAGVVFKGAEKPIIRWSKTTAEKIGISQRAALEATGTFGNMLVPMGFARKKAAGMSKSMVNLAGDMASFNNASPEEVLEALRAGLAGETEPLRRFGVFLNDARLKQEAMNLGLKDAIGPNGALTANAKAQATYSLILKDTKDAQGDFARTSSSLANQQRILKAEGENAAASLGSFLIPTFQTLAGWSSSLIGAFNGLTDGQKKIVVTATALVAALTPIILIAGKLTTAITVLTPVVTAVAGAIWAAVGASAAFVAANAVWIAAIAAVIAAGVLLYKNWDTVSAFLGGIWDWLSAKATTVFNAVKDVVVGTWNFISSATSTVWNGIKGILTTIWSAIGPVVRFWFTFYKEFITSIWNVVKLATGAIWGEIKRLLGIVWNAIKVVATPIFGAIRTIVVGAWEFVRDRGTTIWNGIKTFLGTIWGGIRSVASTAWTGIKNVIWNPVKDVVGDVHDKVDWLAGALGRIWGRITDGVSTFAGKVKDGVVGAFKGILGKIMQFAIKILEIVGKIPGVSFEGSIKSIKSTGKDWGLPGFARGGVMESGGGGGKVMRPMAVVGEEAPRHHEYVVPTNPAYRGRALGLFGSLGADLGVPGFADGGVIGAFKEAVKRTHAGPKSALALFEAGWVESKYENLPYGDRDSRGALQIRDATARGMGIDNMNPLASALAFLTRGFWGKGSAISLAKTPGTSAGWVAQQTQGSAFPSRYDAARSYAVAAMNAKGLPIFSGGQSLGGKIVESAASLISKLPNPGDFFPDWMKGLGSKVISGVSGWIKDKVTSILPDTPGRGDIPKGVAGSVSDAITLAMRMGFAHPSANQITGGRHAEGSLHYAGRAVDFGDAGHTLNEMKALWAGLLRHFGSHINELFYDKMPFYIDNHRKVEGQFGGHDDHIHIGFARGGRVRVGELGPEDVYLPNGSYVTPASRSRGGDGDGPLIGEVVINHGADEREIARKLAWLVS